MKGMLPKNPLGRRMFRKLHVFAGGEHPHQAQQPQAARNPIGTDRMPASQQNHYGTGRRKTATARVYLKPGTGQHHGQRPFAR